MTSGGAAEARQPSASPFVDIAADQAVPFRQSDLLIGRIKKPSGRRTPPDTVKQNRRHNDPRQSPGIKILVASAVVGAVDQRRSSALWGSTGSTRSIRCRTAPSASEDQHHAPIGVRQPERLDDLEERNEQQRIREQVGQKNAGCRMLEPQNHAAE